MTFWGHGERQQAQDIPIRREPRLCDIEAAASSLFEKEVRLDRQRSRQDARELLLRAGEAARAARDGWFLCIGLILGAGVVLAAHCFGFAG